MDSRIPTAILERANTREEAETRSRASISRRLWKSMETGNQHRHADHAAEHVGRKALRQDSHCGEHPAADKDQEEGEHGNAEDELPLVSSLHQKVPVHHRPECRSRKFPLFHHPHFSLFALWRPSTPAWFVRTRNTSLRFFVPVFSCSSCTVP